MEILFIATEVSPYSKVGGLADVASALPYELARSGIRIKVITPLYSLIEADKFGIRSIGIKGSIPLGSGTYSYKIVSIPEQSGQPVQHLFVHSKKYFFRSGIYTKPNGEGYPDNNARFFFFQKVIMDLITKGHVDPDIIHINDHHSALIPYLLKKGGIHLPSLLTVHNFHYQGHFSQEELLLLKKGEAESIQQNFTPLYNFYNALEIGLKSADLVNTVSVNYAKELLKKKEVSFGLEKVLKSIQPKFSGILNGVDYTTWNPEIDPYLDIHFSPENLEGKRINKKRLKKRCGFPDNTDSPLFGSVSRLVESKGFDLIMDILNKLAQLDIQMIFLGTGEKKIKDSLQAAAKKHPNRLSFYSTFDEAFAHLIEAGSDMFLMPSRFEPCGLNQMYSLKYGTIPIVHRTGGLADTVFEWDGKRGNGFIFKKYTSKHLLRAVKRAIHTYNKQSQWTGLMKNAMEEDFSWSKSAQKYRHLYDQLIKRKD